MDLNNMGPLGPNKDQLERISTLVARHVTAAREIAAAEDRLKEAKRALRAIDEVDIPTLMDECGVLSLVTSDGSHVAIEEHLTASIPKAKRPAAAAWLAQNGLSSLITHSVTASFPNEEEERARKLTVELAERDLITNYDMAFNTSSLKAAVRERLRDGKPVDFDVLGVFNVRKAIVKEVKS